MAAAGALLVACATPAAPRPSGTVSPCGDPTAHVYRPGRLLLQNPCLTVSGTVRHITPELDGDDHVRLQLDPAYAGMVNQDNLDQQGGDLVLEPICKHPAVQPNAIPACSGYTNPIDVPPPGTHVVASGAYVLDSVHGWLELHPLFDIHPG